MKNTITYKVELKKAHLEWGTHRYTNSRGKVYGEGYIPIPARISRTLNLFNSNGTGGEDREGENLFKCTSKDKSFSCVLKAQGCRKAGDPYAKQFSANNNLKALGKWYAEINAEVGDIVEVEIKGKKILIEKK